MDGKDTKNIGKHDECVRYGKYFPNRLFVGCLPSKVRANDLAEFFENFGSVIEAKVILDNNMKSKRFGFVSFATEGTANYVLNMGSIYMNKTKINVGPAIKRQVTDIPESEPVKIAVANPVIDMPPAKKPKYRYSVAMETVSSNQIYNDVQTNNNCYGDGNYQLVYFLPISNEWLYYYCC